ncbi:kinase-like domain-containing protein [Phakopsora pachyrhizi]|uniref:Kinase-like domain-containing protein n=1 Tax=Phakopsora pachyrhizi TaxID=170000 RepID=A0AAV0BSE7_PHAPC|nr:kinase-like domain-containing protein [Phakopsora pachyrhizi]CAH7689572.1 kinase-like domain-containing protein [Phakopsora pachyrhizi]
MLPTTLPVDWQYISSTFHLPNPGHKKISDFQLTKVIGTGDVSRVWLARRKVDNLPCAIKVMQKKYYIDTRTSERALDELEILQSLRHQFIVSIRGAFSNNSYLFLEMDFASRKTLRHIIENHPEMSRANIRFYISQIAIALDFLHSKQILFRDLRPSNVLIDSEGYIKLTDFGSAIRIPDGVCNMPFINRNIFYSAPEIFTNRYDFSADWWSLGVIMFKMAYMGLPFGHPIPPLAFNLKEILYERLTFPCRIGSPGEKLLRRLLSRDPSDRHLSICDIKEEHFFTTLDWDKLLSREMKPPYLPSEISIPWDSSLHPTSPESERQSRTLKDVQIHSDDLNLEQNKSEDDDIFSAFTYTEDRL